MRRARKQYKDRNTQPPERTKEVLQEMLSGSEEGSRWCLRARWGLIADCASQWDNAQSAGLRLQCARSAQVQCRVAHRLLQGRAWHRRLQAAQVQLPLPSAGALKSMQGSGSSQRIEHSAVTVCLIADMRAVCRINLEGEMTYARVDDDGNAVREADGSLEMRPAQPMEYANGVRYGWPYSMMQIESHGQIGCRRR
jgi:hypothetical protein